MRDRLVGLLEKADLAVGSCSGVVDPERLDPLIEVTSRVRARLSYPEDVLVVALAGGTGSGKSSLFNAMTDADLVDVGGTRPTTRDAAVAVPEAIGSAMDGYLDHLDIEERFRFEGPRFCVIDLPDTDSVELEHRHRVDVLLPRVDVVVWVVDPEKYRDARLHDDYLKRMLDYEHQFLFVLNQIDRLPGSNADVVAEDFVEALSADGLERPTVVAMAASPPAGPSIGVDDLYAELEQLRDDSDTLYSKLVTDIGETARTLESAVGTPLDFDRRAKTTVSAAAMQIVAGETDGATGRVVEFLDEIAAPLDGSSRSKVERVAAETPAHIDRIVSEVTPPQEPKRWFRRSQEPATPDPAETERLINQAIVRPVRAVLAKRALAIAAVAELGVAVQSLGTRPSQ